MKKNLRTITKTIIILASMGLLTACGATGTVNTSNYDIDMAVGTEIQDLGIEEYVLAENGSVATDEEKQMKYILYLEETLANDIASAYPSVKDVDVTLAVKDGNAALTGIEEETQVKVCLDLEEELAEDSIIKIAEAVATATDSATYNVTIQDAEGKILYSKK